MTLPKALFSSARTGDGKDNWGTPWPIFNYFEQLFDEFDVDVCADPKNAKVANYFGKVGFSPDGLAVPWNSIYGGDQGVLAWMNPPYSKTRQWLRKAIEECKAGNEVVALIAARTDTIAFHEALRYTRHLYLLKGRIPFLGANGKPIPNPETGKPVGAPFPSAVLFMTDRDEHDKVELHTVVTKEIMCEST